MAPEWMVSLSWPTWNFPFSNEIRCPGKLFCTMQWVSEWLCAKVFFVFKLSDTPLPSLHFAYCTSTVRYRYFPWYFFFLFLLIRFCAFFSSFLLACMGMGLSYGLPCAASWTFFSCSVLKTLYSTGTFLRGGVSMKTQRNYPVTPHSSRGPWLSPSVYNDRACWLSLTFSDNKVHSPPQIDTSFHLPFTPYLFLPFPAKREGKYFP